MVTVWQCTEQIHCYKLQALANVCERLKAEDLQYHMQYLSALESRSERKMCCSGTVR